MAFSQFGLDFETVWWTLFLLLFFISAILWHLSLKGLFDGLIWTLLQKNLKSTLRTVLKAAVQPIWAWFWNGFVDLVPPALLYLYYVIAFVSKRTIWWVNHHHQSSFKNNLFGVSSLSGAPLNDVTKWRRRQLFFSFLFSSLARWLWRTLLFLLSLARRSMTSPNEGDDNYFSLFLFSSLTWWRWQTLLLFLLIFWRWFTGLVNRLPFRQFGLDFETVFGSLFLLLFCISAILWPLALNRLFDPINPTWKVYWAAVPPIRPWPWNGFRVLVPPALLYLRYFMIGFEILNISCSIFGRCGKKWKFCFINFEGQ